MASVRKPVRGLVPELVPVAVCPYNLRKQQERGELLGLDLHLDLCLVNGCLVNECWFCISCKCYHCEMVVYPAPTSTGTGPNHEFGNFYYPPIQWWLCAKCNQYTVGAHGHCHYSGCGAIHVPPQQTK